ncbi:hypothetical protein P7K49_003444 [Saguinus oedipus]|uniref:Uncharacterized protein n=1 Tax=Saguinus oedipus TaxID=9490 RepID=A0ABQ9W717_SAGOE|nr:hypothetical protein P7K49_003444 [Saguinus oedipus]
MQTTQDAGPVFSPQQALSRLLSVTGPQCPSSLGQVTVSEGRGPSLPAPAHTLPPPQCRPGAELSSIKATGSTHPAAPAHPSIQPHMMVCLPDVRADKQELPGSSSRAAGTIPYNLTTAACAYPNSPACVLQQITPPKVSPSSTPSTTSSQLITKAALQRPASTASTIL